MKKFITSGGNIFAINKFGEGGYYTPQGDLLRPVTNEEIRWAKTTLTPYTKELEFTPGAIPPEKYLNRGICPYCEVNLHYSERSRLGIGSIDKFLRSTCPECGREEEEYIGEWTRTDGKGEYEARSN